MLKKIIATVRSTVLIWICILVPLLVGAKFIKLSSEKDSLKCVDTFMNTEGAGISKYMALQFEGISKTCDHVVLEVEGATQNDAKLAAKTLKSIVKNNSNIVSISMYEEKNGKFIASSSNDSKTDLNINSDLKKLKDEILYDIGQQKDNTVVINYIMKRNLLANGNTERCIFKFVVRWDQYEKYMDKLQQGSFPRMFYIISPDFKRYISLNSFPGGRKSDRAVIALGMHLAQKIQNIPEGLSDLSIESLDFRIFKDKINMPEKIVGSSLFAVVVTDSTVFEALSNNMFGTVPIIMMMLVAVWLLICLMISRFYNKTKEQLEIANVISDSTPLAIVIFRASDGKIIKINLSAATLLRIEMEKNETVDMWNLFIENDDKSYISNAISSNINVLNYEVLVQSFGGGSFWSICSASPIDIGNNKYIVLAVLDINRRKEIEKKLANNATLLEQQIAERTADLEQKAKELEESNALLERSKLIADEANSAKSKFLANMSNELKTPINAIIGYSEILEEEALDRKDTVSASDLRKVVGSAKHLLSLIDEILDLSKIEAGKTQLFFENIEIGSIIKDVEGITMPLVTNNDNSLFLEYDKDIGIMYSDSTKIRQCLLNLLSNAAKFTEFGKITLRVIPIVKGGEDFLEFSVIDTGAGIQSDRIDSIFDPFQGNNCKNSGAGLGLSITKKYVEYLGGMILAESEEGVGSKFIIRVPRVCKTISNEFVELKNQCNDESLDEEDYQTIDTTDMTNEAKSFARKSDQQEV